MFSFGQLIWRKRRTCKATLGMYSHNYRLSSADKTNGGERGVIRGAPAMVLGKYGKGIRRLFSVLAKSSIKANVCPPPKTTPPNQRNSFADEREQQR